MLLHHKNGSPGGIDLSDEFGLYAVGKISATDGVVWRAPCDSCQGHAVHGGLETTGLYTVPAQVVVHNAQSVSTSSRLAVNFTQA
jgi:hypothetical protein